MSSTPHRARKRFGQHFLTDEQVIHAIIGTLHPKDTDTLIEIGPGLGALTLPLLERGLALTLIELDRDLVMRWQRYPAQSQLTILSQDVLSVDFTQFGHQWRVIGNLPYNISTPLLFHLSQYAEHLRDAHFMLQKEVVDRLVALPGTSAYGRLSVMMQYHFHMEALITVEPEAFSPPPKVRSGVIQLIPKHQQERPLANLPQLTRLLAKAFAQRRKMLRSSLKDWVSDDALNAMGIDPTRRAETLSLEEFCHLSVALSPLC